MYYINFFFFNFLNIKFIKFNLTNIYLVNLNNLILNFLIIIIIYIFIKNIEKYYNFIFIILVYQSILVKKLFVISDFYFGFYKIHPIIFYTSIITFFYKIQLKNNIFRINYLILFLICMYSFFLGSLWALYQSKWGFYWSNDSIEILLLFLIIANIINIHRKFNNYVYQFYFLLQIIFLLTCLRFNILYTKHNFFGKTTTINIYQYVLFLIFFIKILIYPLTYKYILKFNILIWLIIIYTVEIFFNLINIKLFYLINFVIVLIFLINYSKLIVIYLKKKKFIHILNSLVLIFFNILSINYEKKYTLIYLYIQKKFNTIFYFTKNFNNIIFFKQYQILNFFFLSTDLLDLKISSITQQLNNCQLNVVNYF